MAVQMYKNPFTMEDVEKAKKIHRCVEFNKDEHGNIYEISWTEPCELCGKYHHFGSNASKICNMKLACGIASAMRDVISEKAE